MKIGVSSYSFQRLMKEQGYTYIDVCNKAKELGFDGIDAPLSKVVSARRANLLEVNKTALKLGYDY